MKEVSKEYAIPRSPESDKTIKLFEDREDRLMDKCGIVDCDDYTVEYRYNGRVYYSYEDVMYLL